MNMKLFTRHTLFDLINELVPTTAIIVEAGAFDGTDTKRFSQWRPQGQIHAFEPVPEIFDLLCVTTTSLSNVTCYPYALSNRTGQQSFYLSEHPKYPGKPFQAGSLCKPKERLALSPIIYPHTTTVHTITLDQWASDYTIPHIDLLWLDVQGHALDILKASPHILQHTCLVHVEVEFINAYEGQATYKEVVTWLEQQGFELIGADFQLPTHWFFGNILLRTCVTLPNVCLSK
jgi:FkbM family methyltransferase